jgi:hypothetical protein
MFEEFGSAGQEPNGPSGRIKRPKLPCAPTRGSPGGLGRRSLDPRDGFP